MAVTVYRRNREQQHVLTPGNLNLLDVYKRSPRKLPTASAMRKPRRGYPIDSQLIASQVGAG
jgi:hypothetical protein